MPRYFRWHRLVYNVLAVVTLIPALAFDRSVRGEPLFVWSGPWRLLQIALLAAAVALAVLGARGHDLRRFLGLAPATGGGALSTDGILGVTRHPWYLGGLLIIWTTDLDAAVLVRNAVFATYFIVGAWWEERKLVGEFGEAYRDYQRRVPMFLPRFRR